MTRLIPIVLLIFVAVIVSVPIVTAQQPPPATPDPSVIVIPPPSDPIGDILNNPVVLTPRATATYPSNPPPGILRPGASAIVIEEPLNVRTLPSVRDGEVILQLKKGEDLTILQLTADSEWALVDTRGPAFLQGWVNTEFIREPSEVQPFEATSEPDTSLGGSFLLRATETVTIRSDPVIFSSRVGLLGAGAEAEIIGRKSTYQWWKIRTADGTVGWVSSIYVYVVTPAAYQQAPILVD